MSELQEANETRTAACFGCGEEIYTCMREIVDRRARARGFHVTAQECCLLGWRHRRTGFHGCAGKASFASPA
jgi:hypothetical protein